jgi:arylsulfatase A-like enzyme
VGLPEAPGSGKDWDLMHRKTLKSIVSLALLLTPPAALHAAAPNPVAADQPNLVVILTDEHNFRTLGCYRALLSKEQAFIWGDGVAVETPHLDSLAASGAICDRFYAASPVCTPSRAAFFSGRYPQNTGADSNDRPLRDDVVTFAELLRRNGYATGYAGKWHLDGNAKPGWSPARKFGFDDNQYMFNRGHYKQLEDTPAGPAVKARNQKGEPTYDVTGADAKSFTTDFLADKTVAFIQTHKDGPFCFVTSIPDPHGPNTVRPPYDTMFAAMKFQQPRSAFESGVGLPACAMPPAKPQLENMSHYFGMVKCIDENVGKILAALRDAGVAERTIVVFTSDHGDMCGEHGRVNKGIPLEGSARIPLLISYPGKIRPGTVIHEALNNVDFKPTILALMGVSSAGGDEGRDASALFRTGQAPAGWQDITFSRNSAGNWLMAATRRYKFIVSRDSDPCLFDLDADPFELRNIFSQPSARETVRELGRALAEYAKRCQEPHADQPAVRADLTWAAEGTGKYAAPPRGANKTKAGKTRRGPGAQP